MSFVRIADALVEHGITVHKDTVSYWAQGKQRPSPEEVFALEKVLGLRGGTLSQHDGYLPLDAKPIRSFADAVEADSQLTPAKRRYLRRLYRELLTDD